MAVPLVRMGTAWEYWGLLEEKPEELARKLATKRNKSWGIMWGIIRCLRGRGCGRHVGRGGDWR